MMRWVIELLVVLIELSELKELIRKRDMKIATKVQTKAQARAQSNTGRI